MLNNSYFIKKNMVVTMGYKQNYNHINSSNNSRILYGGEFKYEPKLEKLLNTMSIKIKIIV